MAGLNLLSDKQISKVKEGYSSDGGNLYVRRRGDGRTWVFRFKVGLKSEWAEPDRLGKPIELGLGSYPAVSLKLAREKADRLREEIAAGRDPRLTLNPTPKVEPQSFEVYAKRFILKREQAHEHGANKHKSAKHMKQWPSTMERYVYPVIGKVRPNDITYAHIENIVGASDIVGKPETIYRVLQRVKAILEYAAEYDGEPQRYNPAERFKLARPSAQDIRNHASAPWAECPAIMAALALRDSTSARVLRWSIATACRSGEARGALWSEVDLARAVWTVGRDRMKGNREWRQPLNAEALAVLAIQAEHRVADNPLIFPGPRGGQLSDVAMNQTLHAIKPDVTAHGFRSSFRMWGADAGLDRQALEFALAHTIKDRVESAYMRSDLFDIRVDIMAKWAAFLSSKTLAASSD
jgi:integrase